MALDRDHAIQDFVRELDGLERRLRDLLAVGRVWPERTHAHVKLQLVNRDFQQLKAHALDLMREIAHLDVQRAHLTGSSTSSGGVRRPPPDPSSQARETVAPPHHPPPHEEPPPTAAHAEPTPVPEPEPAHPAEPPATDRLSRLVASMPESIRRRLHDSGIE
ncbi:MAG: hypothetical protein KF858_01220 [Candidatus Sumerlaeia bacterium]|nr:hypothetical protein [Candidatus Sumerlaeia bacterium]